MRRALLAALLIAAAGTAAAQVPVAFVIPSGGQYEELSTELADTAEYVVAYLNDRDGRPMIELEIFEDGCSEDRAREIAMAFAGDGWEGFKPEIVLGHCPDVLGEVARIYAAAGVPFFSPLAPSDARIYQPNASVFQVEPDGWLMAERTVEALERNFAELQQLRGEQVGVLTDETAYTRLFADVLTAGLSGIAGETSIASAAADLGDAQVVFYAGTEPKAYDQLMALSEARGTRLVFVRRGVTPGHEWFRLMDEVQDRGLDVRTIMPASQYDAYAAPDYGLPVFQDTTAQLVLASFELAMQALAASGGYASGIPWQIRSQGYPTILGPLQSGEIGKIGPLQAEIVMTDEWLRDSRYGMESAAEEAPPTPVGSEPVYNLEIEPLVESSPIVLKADTATELRFFIGGSTQANVLGDSVINLEDIQQLAGDERLAISVTLNCLVCETGNYQRRGLIYDPIEGRSTDTVTFTIVPKRNRVDPETGTGLLLFVIDARGIDLDVIQVPIFVGAPTPEQRAAYQAPAVRAIHHEENDELESPDLIIDITDAPVALDVTLIPKLTELVDELRRELGGTNQEEWTFKAGASKADVDGLVRMAYFELRAMVNQNEDILQRVYEAQGGAVVLGPGAANLDLNDSDRDAMLEVLRKHGARLYQRVFVDADPALRRAMRVLENFTPADDRPLSVRIRASNVYAPWQLLYPERRRDIVAERFWGLRYTLGTRQLVNAAPVSFATIMDPPDPDETLFAAYRAGSTDPVAARARLLADHVSAKVGAALDLAESREEFLNRLEHEGRIMRLIVAYGHASSGTEVGTGPVGRAVIYDQVIGARFMLAADEAIVPADIDERRPDPEEGLLLASQPIVIFNACETGSGGARAANNNGFVGVLTRAGARAVIVTETPVWNNFAYHFGTHIIDGLFEGKRIDVALRDARLRHLETWNNPLGLVYTLYGNSAARIALPDDGP